jgi:hypothetical protein
MSSTYLRKKLKIKSVEKKLKERWIWIDRQLLVPVVQGWGVK